MATCLAGIEPRTLGPVPLLKILQLFFVAHDLIELIETFEQGGPTLGIDRKRHGLSIRQNNPALPEIDREFWRRRSRNLGCDGLHLGLGQFDRQQTVLKAILKKDIAEARRDHAFDAEFYGRQDGGLPRAPAAEILACDQDLAFAIT